MHIPSLLFVTQALRKRVMQKQARGKAHERNGEKTTRRLQETLDTPLPKTPQNTQSAVRTSSGRLRGGGEGVVVGGSDSDGGGWRAGGGADAVAARCGSSTASGRRPFNFILGLVTYSRSQSTTAFQIEKTKSAIRFRWAFRDMNWHTYCCDPGRDQRLHRPGSSTGTAVAAHRSRFLRPSYRRRNWPPPPPLPPTAAAATNADTAIERPRRRRRRLMPPRPPVTQLTGAAVPVAAADKGLCPVPYHLRTLPSP